MLVYIVESGNRYEGSEIEDIFLDRQCAIKYAERLVSQSRFEYKLEEYVDNMAWEEIVHGNEYIMMYPYEVNEIRYE